MHQRVSALSSWRSSACSGTGGRAAEARLQRRADEARLRRAGPGRAAPAGVTMTMRGRAAACCRDGGPRAARRAVGPGAVLGQGRQDRQPHDQRQSRDGCREAGLPPCLRQRRCLLPADGYYEWQQHAGRSPSSRSTSAGATGSSLAFAGLYELWRDPAVDRDDDDAWLWTTTIITTSAPDELGMIHDRMPMIIDPASWGDWLDPANSDAPTCVRCWPRRWSAV